MRPIVVVALAITAVILPPLLVDLYEFVGRELEYRRFRRHFEGQHDKFLRADWTPDGTVALHARLIRERGKR